MSDNKYIKTATAVTAGVMMMFSSAAIDGDMMTVMDCCNAVLPSHLRFCHNSVRILSFYTSIWLVEAFEQRKEDTRKH